LSKLMTRCLCSPNIFLKVRSAFGSKYFAIIDFSWFFCKITNISQIKVLFFRKCTHYRLILLKKSCNFLQSYENIPNSALLIMIYFSINTFHFHSWCRKHLYIRVRGHSLRARRAPDVSHRFHKTGVKRLWNVKSGKRAWKAL
jgi:hypothetical protein